MIGEPGWHRNLPITTGVGEISAEMLSVLLRNKLRKFLLQIRKPLPRIDTGRHGSTAFIRVHPCKSVVRKLLRNKFRKFLFLRERLPRHGVEKLISQPTGAPVDIRKKHRGGYHGEP
ncbi:MAG: hypothetical protein ACREP2_02100 [Rhodanobacteraceae bacterium]